MSGEFCNNLDKDNRVFDTVSGRQGKVARQPQSDKQRMTPIIYDGTNSVVYRDVMQLRLVLNGRTPEDDPPVDFPELAPPLGPKAPPPQAIQLSPTAAAAQLLRDEKERNNAEIETIEKRFKVLKASNEKLDAAIVALS